MNKMQRVVLVIVSTVALVIAGCSPGPAPQALAPSSIPSPDVGTRVGNLAPDFQLLDLDQEPVSLSGLRGKPVVLNFWATWCPPCVDEMPYLQEIYDEYSSEGLMLLAIDVGESQSQVEEFLQRNNLSLPVLLDTEGVVVHQYTVITIPTTYFIDGDGIIQSKRIGAFMRKGEIEKELGKIMPGQ